MINFLNADSIGHSAVIGQLNPEIAVMRVLVLSFIVGIIIGIIGITIYKYLWYRVYLRQLKRDCEDRERYREITRLN